MKLYFIALLPDQVIQDEVTAFKQTALERFESGQALKSPPHITLIPPFRSNETQFSALQSLANKEKPFQVDLRNFDRFSSRVIYVNVLPHPTLLHHQKRLADLCSSQWGIIPDSRPFHPHMTVAFKDLKRSVFPEAWAYFSTLSYERFFMAQAFTLLVHSGQRWEVDKTFPFA
ncbi:MAG: 2-5 ligase [Spirosoma sp.]|nr:2-5 ligase [Spirosoma sp.]